MQGEGSRNILLVGAGPPGQDTDKYVSEYLIDEKGMRRIIIIIDLSFILILISPCGSTG